MWWLIAVALSGNGIQTYSVRVPTMAECYVAAQWVAAKRPEVKTACLLFKTQDVITPLSCDGSAVGMNVCFEKAGELCKGRGYDLVSREGQVVPFGTASVNQYSGSPSSAV